MPVFNRWKEKGVLHIKRKIALRHWRARWKSRRPPQFSGRLNTILCSSRSCYLPLVNQLFDLCAPSSTDVPVLLLNQPIRDLTNGNGNVTKATGVISKTTILHMHHAFSYISLSSLHNWDVKWRNFKITSGPEWQGDKFYHICMHWGAVLSLQLQHKFPSFR